PKQYRPASNRWQDEHSFRFQGGEKRTDSPDEGWLPVRRGQLLDVGASVCATTRNISEAVSKPFFCRCSASRASLDASRESLESPFLRARPRWRQKEKTSFLFRVSTCGVCVSLM